MGGVCAKVIGGLGMAAVLFFVSTGAGSADEEPVAPLPTVRTLFSAKPSPVPTPGQGRVPVGLRLLDRISTTDSSHPRATKAILVELDQQLDIHLAKVERCPSGVHFDIRTPKDPCAEFRFGTGTITIEAAFPGQQPLSVTGRAIAFAQGPGKLMIHVDLPAPTVGRIAIPITVGKEAGGGYGIKMIAAVPKIGGGYGSITSLDLRFRKGIFSAACPQGRLQSRATNTFADGSTSAAGVITTC